MNFDEELTEAARSLHREWDSPQLWPDIAQEIQAIERAERRARVIRHTWLGLAAAAAIILAVSASLVVDRDRSTRVPRSSAPVVGTNPRLLSDDALSAVERAEAEYVAAIETLARKADAQAQASGSPVLAHLRERLLVIDTAIADCREEIERNRFNAHLRRQLLSMYQEKRRTLEQILEQEQHAS